ncbi:MAG: DUF4032 domain-containing protein [Thermoleophilia bacterium]
MLDAPGAALRLSVADPTDHPDFLDLPLHRPLDSWVTPRLVPIPDGLHRHVVRFVDYEGAVYALKELPRRLARREYRLLRHLRERGLPCVTAVGLVDRGADAQAIIITRYLDYSLPYRVLLTHERMPHLQDRVLDALAGLLVRLHLTGFFWGDCSLANTLFRRDAGALVAYVVDTETGELHAELSRGQRELDLQIAHENIAGGLADLAAGGLLPEGLDPFALAAQIRERYTGLWDEVTAEQVFPAGDGHRIHERLHRLNQLGFDLEEMEITRSGDGETVRFTPRVVEVGFHGPRLRELTGLVAQENQARRLLNDIAVHRGRLEQQGRVPVPETVAAARWLDAVFRPTVERIPHDLRGRLEPVEVYHEILEHRWFRSERHGHDVGMREATRSYLQTVLRDAPEERGVITVEEVPDDPAED